MTRSRKNLKQRSSYTSRTTVSIALVILCCAQLIAQPNFSFNGFKLNDKVSFNDVANRVKPDGKIITEPSVYIIGEEIKYIDKDKSEVTLVFQDQSNILKAIIIRDLLDTHGDMFSFLQDYLVKDRLGEPVDGFDLTVQNQTSYMTMTHYEFEYRYKFDTKHFIDIDCTSEPRMAPNGNWYPSYTISAYFSTYPVDFPLPPVYMPTDLRKTGSVTYSNATGTTQNKLVVTKVY